MKRLAWLVPVFVLVACAEREKQVESSPAPTEQQAQPVEPVKAGKFNGIAVKKPFVSPDPGLGTAAAASASASAK